MKTIKAFKKGMIADNMMLEVGKTYNIPINTVSFFSSGYTASNNFDISDTLEFFPDLINTEYALVDINPIYQLTNIIYGNKITILNKIPEDELYQYDKTGKWIIEYLKQMKITDENIIKIYQNKIIQIDKTGKYCFEFAKNIKGADIRLLEDEVIKKDLYGGYCFEFALHIPYANKDDLQNAIISKGNCDIIYQYAFYVDGANIELLEDAIIKYDTTGYWCDIFANTIQEANVQKLKISIQNK